MASGCILKYTGSRGTTWSIKFTDAQGRQVRERLGKASEGWTKRKAESTLRARLVEIERNSYRRPDPETFRSFVDGWEDEHCDAAGLKWSTRRSYGLIVAGHLEPFFGASKLSEIDLSAVERYMSARRRAGASPRTVNRDVNVLSLILGTAMRRGKMAANPVPLVVRPREKRTRWKILTPAEVGMVEASFRDLIAEAEDEERKWREQSRVIFLLAVDTGVRRGEVAGLHWRSVALADPAGPRIRVEETFTRQRVDTPKSASGFRTIEVSQLVADELFAHRGDDERVFCSPSRGTPFDFARYGATFRLALGKAEIEGRVRPFHDMRHTSITNGAAAGMTPAALQKRAGHSAFSTTQRYIDLAGVEFPEEAAKLSERLWGASGTKTRYEVRPQADEPAQAEA
jgi:integrase